MKKERFFHSVCLFFIKSPRKRAKYLKKHNVLGCIGENCSWGPWLVPLYPKLIKIHDNVHVHKTAKILTHDMVNRFLQISKPESDFGPSERLGCVELMDNVYVSFNVTILPDVHVGKNCILSAGTVINSDVPENSVVAGNPAHVVGRFDVYMALRKMSRGQNVAFDNQNLSNDLADQQWLKFKRKRNPV